MLPYRAGTACALNRTRAPCDAAPSILRSRCNMDGAAFLCAACGPISDAFRHTVSRSRRRGCKRYFVRYLATRPRLVPCIAPLRRLFHCSFTSARCTAFSCRSVALFFCLASPCLALLFALVFRVVARRCSFVLLRYPLPWAFRRAYTAPEERRAEMSSKTDTRTGHRGCSRLTPAAAPEECPRTRDREITQATSGEESRA